MGQVAGTDEEEALAATTCTLMSVRERPGRHGSARVTLVLCAQGSPGSCTVAAGSGTCQYVPLVAGGTDTIRDDLQKVLHATSPLLDAAPMTQLCAWRRQGLGFSAGCCVPPAIAIAVAISASLRAAHGYRNMDSYADDEP